MMNKCPNIWCNDRLKATKSCACGVSYRDNCQLRKNYEAEFCPSEEEYEAWLNNFVITKANDENSNWLQGF